MNALGRFAWFSLGFLAGLFGVAAVVAGVGVQPQPGVSWLDPTSSATALLAVGGGLVAVYVAVQVVRLVHLPHPGRVWLGAFGVFAVALGGLLASSAVEAKLSGAMGGWEIALTVSQGNPASAGPVVVTLAVVLVAATIRAASRYAAEYHKSEPPAAGGAVPATARPTQNRRRWLAVLVRLVRRVYRGLVKR